MATHIQSINSTVRTVEESTLLTPEVMRQILQNVLQAVDDHLREMQRERSIRRITPGVAYELEHEE